MGARKTTEQFIEDAKAVHGDKYDYSLTAYYGNKIPVVIVCSKHGEFEQVPVTHLKGANCFKCGKDSMADKCRGSVDKFIEESKEKHGDKYDYSKVEYSNNRTKVIICCPTHGDYLKTPSKHKEGSGCKKCLDESNTKTTENYIKECKKVHNNLYTYKNTIYTHSNDSVIVTCKFHGDFEQKAKTHREGCGCPKCARETGRFKRSDYIKLKDTATLYLIKVYNDNEVFYKIGKTTYTVKERFAGGMPYKYEIVNTLTSEIGFIFDLEIELHRKYKDYKHKPSIDFAGRTECYNLKLPLEEIINIKG